jgi:SAGA-associated factor 29
MSSRNRSGRGSNRNNGNNANSDHGEEAQLWESIKARVSEVVVGVNAESKGLSKLVEMDKEMGSMDSEKIPGASLKEMEQLCRAGVRQSDDNILKARELVDQLKILRAVCVAKEQAEAAVAGPSKRSSARDNAASAAALYDFDGAGDSPVPSPHASGSQRKFGDRVNPRERDRESQRGDRDRDSMPPKAESVEPQGVSTPLGLTGGAVSRSKVVFSKGESVAFKPKTVSGEAASDWILGEVAQVLGEGKSRRYKVIDVEPEEQSKQKEYRTSASSMIPITPESQAATLGPWEPKTTVLALYPNTTTFYRAEVHSMDEDGRVNLKFEGENDSSTLQQVERRFVIEYRP